MNNQNLDIMGVINITPDSFSDGGKSVAKKSFKESFLSMSKGVSIIDIGAESTAPFNPPIDSSEELKRFNKILYPNIELLKNHIVSIDTYKVDVFRSVYLELKKELPELKIIFNDVSGCVDSELLEIINDKSFDFTYVLSHNLAPTRDQTSFHMGHTQAKLNIEGFFEDNLAKLENKNIIVDPCFGFSKTREQNLELLNSIDAFVSRFKDHQIMFGISRKSFLRIPKDLDAKDANNQQKLDAIQTHYLVSFIESINRHSTSGVARLHNPNSALAALDCVSLKFD